MSSNMVTLIHKQSNMSGVCHVWMTGVGVAALVSISGAKKRSVVIVTTVSGCGILSNTAFKLLISC